MSSTTSRNSVRRARWFFLIAATVLLAPALYGFATKFSEFLALAANSEGAFTIVPIVNYLLATLGFVMLLCWATLHGMFRDIERPKYTMLEQEQKLDEDA